MYLYESEAFHLKTSKLKNTLRTDNQLQESKRLIEQGHDSSLVLNYSLLEHLNPKCFHCFIR